MKSIAVTSTCLVAIFSVGAFSAAPASAAEGPFYKVNGVRLNGEKTIKAKLTEEYVFKILAPVEAAIRCKEMTYGSGTIRGLKEKTSDTGKGIVTLKMCTVEGNGMGCAVENGEIKHRRSQAPLPTANRRGKVKS
jgi:hypothetical protein